MGGLFTICIILFMLMKPPILLMVGKPLFGSDVITLPDQLRWLLERKNVQTNLGLG
jgi:hypothetical protein